MPAVANTLTSTHHGRKIFIFSRCPSNANRSKARGRKGWKILDKRLRHHRRKAYAAPPARRRERLKHHLAHRPICDRVVVLSSRQVVNKTIHRRPTDPTSQKTNLSGQSGRRGTWSCGKAIAGYHSKDSDRAERIRNPIAPSANLSPLSGRSKLTSLGAKQRFFRPDTEAVAAAIIRLFDRLLCLLLYNRMRGTAGACHQKQDINVFDTAFRKVDKSHFGWA